MLRAKTIIKFHHLITSGRSYIKKADRLLQEGNLEQVESFKEELSRLINGFKEYKESVKFPRILIASQKKLEDTLKDIYVIEGKIINYKFNVQRGTDLLIHMRDLEFPASATEREVIGISSVDSSKIFFEKDLLEELASADPPKRR